MGVFTFILTESAGAWSAKQLNGDLEASSDGAYDIQRKLVEVSTAADSSGSAQTSFSYVTPSSAVFQVIVGGGVAIGGVAAVSGASGGASDAQAAPAMEEKKENEEESDDEPIFSLFEDE